MAVHPPPTSALHPLRAWPQPLCPLALHPPSPWTDLLHTALLPWLPHAGRVAPAWPPLTPGPCVVGYPWPHLPAAAASALLIHPQTNPFPFHPLPLPTVHLAEDMLAWTSIGILSTFTLEVLAKLAVFGHKYFTHSSWHSFDAFIVIGEWGSREGGPTVGGCREGEGGGTMKQVPGSDGGRRAGSLAGREPGKQPVRKGSWGGYAPRATRRPVRGAGRIQTPLLACPPPAPPTLLTPPPASRPHRPPSPPATPPSPPPAAGLSLPQSRCAWS